LTRTAARAKKRIKEIFGVTEIVSAVIALATPRRIKASHRRRRRVTSDHLLYILNNPLSGTDPTGYCSADAGSHIKNCETITVTDTKTGESASGLANKGTFGKLAASGVGTLSNGGSGGQGSMGSVGRKNEAAPPSQKNAAPNSNSGPSYGRRSLATGYGIAVGLFGSISGVVGGQLDADAFEKFGSGLYDDTTLATDFQGGHNFGYVLGFVGLITSAKSSSGAKPSAGAVGGETAGVGATSMRQPAAGRGTQSAVSAPVSGGGANVENIPEIARNRIQAFATKYNTNVSIVGSRAKQSGGNGTGSDWDYVLSNPPSKLRARGATELPRGRAGGEMTSKGWSGQDFLEGPVDTARPFITFRPTPEK
jgi:hypothetical protein